ncbi:MAG: DUF3943 domain-containing protein [Thermodesulfobacteriota bacterium]
MRQLQFLVALCALLLLPPRPLLANTGNTLDDPATIGLAGYDYCGTCPGQSSGDNVTEEFNLSRYYDELEPPSQDGKLGRYSTLGEDALYFLVPAFAVLGTLYIMPEDISNWNKDEITWEHSKDNWSENVSHWRWDEDDALINYVGHPYFGSTYYIYARHYGYSRTESFWFSFTVSFFYEFALEAWAEPISIQDMIFTPVLGTILGEALLPLEHKIKQNNKKVLGSRTIGAVSLFLIDPFGHIIPPLKGMVDSTFATDSQVQFNPVISQNSKAEQQYGLNLTVNW